MISSSVERPQFSASRFVRNVLETVGHPLRLIRAFHVPDSVFAIVAIRHLITGRCTDIVPIVVWCQIECEQKDKLVIRKSMILLSWKMVARDRIELPTRGFSDLVKLYLLGLTELNRSIKYQ
jgi:hypothetical protein